MQIETADVHKEDMTDPEDQFTVSNVLLSENAVILTVKDL